MTIISPLATNLVLVKPVVRCPGLSLGMGPTTMKLVSYAVALSGAGNHKFRRGPSNCKTCTHVGRVGNHYRK